MEITIWFGNEFSGKYKRRNSDNAVDEIRITKEAKPISSNGRLYSEIIISNRSGFTMMRFQINVPKGNEAAKKFSIDYIRLLKDQIEGTSSLQIEKR